VNGSAIVITGGMGFIGSHLAEALLLQGSTVTVIDDLSTGRAENVAHLRNHPLYRETIADVSEAVSQELLENEADLIIHMAAAVGVRRTVENPVETIDTNVATTTAVLRAARRRNTKVLLASSSEVYGKTSKVPFAEDDDLVLGSTDRPRWSYAASKIIDELMTLGCWREFGLPVVIFRLFNVVGIRQSDRYVLPRFVGAALAGQQLEIHGDGTQTRCFTHVDDAVRAILLLAQCDAAVGQIFNIGTDQEISMGELAHRILTTVGVPSASDRCTFVPYSDVYGDSFDDFQRRVPDTSKLTRYTGWTPVHGIDRTIDDVISTYRETGRGEATLQPDGR
jgi:UDP-glucose 4-epimerase